MIKLSFVMPYYRKADDFCRAFPCQARDWMRNDREIVLVMDEDAEEDLVLNFTRSWPDIQWRILSWKGGNHDWRPPCKAINAGIRNAMGEYVLVASPESVFGEGSVDMLLANASDDAYVCGYICRVPQEEWCGNRVVALQAAKDSEATFRPYGSVLFPREAAMAIGGYDECRIHWGGDDDDFRCRLGLYGLRSVYVYAYAMHLEHERHVARGTRGYWRAKTARCQKCSDTFGMGPYEKLYDWRP